MTRMAAIGSIKTSKSRPCRCRQSPNIEDSRPPEARNGRNQPAARERYAKGPCTPVTDDRVGLPSVRQLERALRWLNSISCRRRSVSGGDLVPQLRRRHDLHLRSPRQDPAPDLDRARDAGLPQDRAVGLTRDLLSGMPCRLGHQRRYGGVEAKNDLDLFLVRDDSPRPAQTLLH